MILKKKSTKKTKKKTWVNPRFGSWNRIGKLIIERWIKKKKIIQPKLTYQTHDPNNKIDNFIESKRKKNYED